MKTKKEKQNRLWSRLGQTSLTLLLLFFSLSVFLPFLSSAEEVTPAPEVRMFSKTITGEIAAKSSQGFALLYKSDSNAEYEMWFPFQEAVQFIGGYQSADDMGTGDKVMVTYDQSSDQKSKYLKSVNLMKKGTPPVLTQSEPGEQAEPI